jgi:hypothetical protein
MTEGEGAAVGNIEAFEKAVDLEILICSGLEVGEYLANIQNEYPSRPPIAGIQGNDAHAPVLGAQQREGNGHVRHT